MTRIRGVEGPTISGTGKALPARKAPAPSRQVARTGGVETRYWTHEIGRPPDHAEATSQDLAIEACRAALADARLGPGDLDGLLVVTTTPPRPTVSTANHVACSLGLSGFALELKAGCAGAVYGLVVASSLLALGARRLLVVAAEAWSKILPADPAGPAAVAGDGAAAVVLEHGAGALLGGALALDPAHAGAMMPPGLFPPTPEAIAAGAYELRVTGDVAAAVRDLYPRVFAEALDAAGLERQEVDLCIPHQASRPILRRALRDCGIPPERAFHTLERYGNASSASVLLSLHDARAEGRVAPGARLALLAVGGGISAACAVLRV